MTKVTDETFESEVLQASLPTLVDFWAEWCIPCKIISPIVEEIAIEHNGRIRVVKMDVSTNHAVPARLGIMAIPMLILFKKGKEVTRLIGSQPKETVLEAILPHLD
jgi:thioredoxin 1